LGLFSGKVHSGKCTKRLPVKGVLKVKKWEIIESFFEVLEKEF
jgi:hypothetical protein